MHLKLTGHPYDIQQEENGDGHFLSKFRLENLWQKWESHILKKKHPTVEDVWWTNTVYQNAVISPIVSFVDNIFEEQQFIAHWVLPPCWSKHLTKPGSQHAKRYTNWQSAFTLRPCIESVGLQECLQSLVFWPWSLELVDHQCCLGSHISLTGLNLREETKVGASSSPCSHGQKHIDPWPFHPPQLAKWHIFVNSSIIFLLCICCFTFPCQKPANNKTQIGIC